MRRPEAAAVWCGALALAWALLSTVAWEGLHALDNVMILLPSQ